MRASTYAQDALSGRVDVVASALSQALDDLGGELTHVDIAVAYASVGGVRVLTARTNAAPGWNSSRKRFLVSMDSGFTEPDALLHLSRLPNAEVRVPNANAVLSSGGLRPARPFHPKAYLFRRMHAPDDISAVLTGSANLTVSALSTGAEVVTLQSGHRNTGAAVILEWFEEVWGRAANLDSVLDEYRRKRGLIAPTPPSAEDQDLSARLYSPPPGASVTVSGPDATRLAAASAYWIEAGRLSRNRGRLVPGNQLDAPRGARVFFGFPAASVNRNHIFGDVELRFEGGPFDRHSVRFGNNQMDKVNLPIPTTAGPTTYDGTTLLFEREPVGPTGHARFNLRVVSRSELRRLQKDAGASWTGQMASGRRWGLLFKGER